MASNPCTLLTDRDRDILAALARSPLTAQQLLTLSATFQQPFTIDRLVRRRLQQLTGPGWVCCSQYASTSQAQNYYQLTASGYRALHGVHVARPSDRVFRPVSLGLQEHTQRLAEWIVQLLVAAHRVGIPLNGFYRESQLQLRLGDETRRPDNAFQLVTNGVPFNFVVELDNATEPINSTKERESLRRKVEFYERYQDQNDHRFRVLFVFTKISARLAQLLHVARELARNRDRHLVYACFLEDFLTTRRPLHDAIFLTHHLQMRGLLTPVTSAPVPANTGHLLDVPVLAW